MHIFGIYCNGITGVASLYVFDVVGYEYTFALIPAWINNPVPRKVWDDITYPFQNFSGYTVEVLERITYNI